MRRTYIYRVEWFYRLNASPLETLIGVRALSLKDADNQIQEYAFNRPDIKRTKARFLLKTSDEITQIDLGEVAGRAKIALRA